MTDLDRRIGEDLERLTSLAPLPPTVSDITSRFGATATRRLPVLVGVAAVACVLVAVAGAIVLRQSAREDGGPGITDPPVAAAAEPDVIVFMNPDATQAQIDAIDARLRESPDVVDIEYFDHDQAYAEFRRLYGDDPALIESVTPEILPTSFRLVLVDHDLTVARGLLTELEQLPGVREVTEGSVLQPPEEVPNEVIIPRLIIDLPGWGPPSVTENSVDRPLEYENDKRTVIYQGRDAWLPLISVLTTTGGYGLGNDNRTVEVAGHQALLSPRYGTTQVIGWDEEGETMAMTGYGVEEDDLLTAAEGLVRNPDGRWELAAVPEAMDEVYRTGEPIYATGRNLSVLFTNDDGAMVELHASTHADEAFWGSVTDVLFDGGTAESVSIRGVSGLLTETDGAYRVDWLDREGTVAMRIDLVGDRAEAQSIIDHLVEVDLTTWRELTGAEVAPSTSG